MEKLFNRIRDLKIKKYEVEKEELEIIEEIANILTEKIGWQFVCAEIEEDYLYFEPEYRNFECLIKVEFTPFLRLIYVNDCEDEEVKKKVEDLFKNGLDVE